MIRFYSNQLGYLPQENKVVVLAEDVRKDSIVNEKTIWKAFLWNRRRREI